MLASPADAAQPEKGGAAPDTGARWTGFHPGGILENGAQGRDRTADTAIFSRMLYQLSYLGTRALEACL